MNFDDQKQIYEASIFSSFDIKDKKLSINLPSIQIVQRFTSQKPQIAEWNNETVKYNRKILSQFENKKKEDIKNKIKVNESQQFYEKNEFKQ